ncbi:MAG: glycosyltransferase family A protein [Terracidiphilus sp.]
MKSSVSVIIPVHNRFELTKRSVESVLAQTVPVSEVILVDDGSNDGTSELLPRHIAENPAWRERVLYLHQESQGVSAARNLGIARAKNEWLAFNDNDDLWLPQKLEWQFQALEKYGDLCDLCFTDAWFMNNAGMKATVFEDSGVKYGELIGIATGLEELVRRLQQVWIQTVLARAELVRDTGGFDTTLCYNEDQDLLFRMALRTKFCFVSPPMVLIDRTPPAQRHLGRVTEWHKEEVRLQMLQSLLEKNLTSSGCLPSGVASVLSVRLRTIHSQWANWHLRNGNYEKARQSISRAAQYDLTPGVALKWVLAQIAPGLANSMITWRDGSIRRRQAGSYF